MPDPSTQFTVPYEPVRRRRLWRWFAVGFVVAFLGMLVFYPMSFYDGRGVYETVLWRYYMLEFRQQMQSAGALGPTSGGSAALVTVVVQHLAVAGIFGILLAVIGRLSKSRKAA